MLHNNGRRWICVYFGCIAFRSKECQKATIPYHDNVAQSTLQILEPGSAAYSANDWIDRIIKILMICLLCKPLEQTPRASTTKMQFKSRLDRTIDWNSQSPLIWQMSHSQNVQELDKYIS